MVGRSGTGVDIIYCILYNKLLLLLNKLLLIMIENDVQANAFLTFVENALIEICVKFEKQVEKQVKNFC
jgi:hypothetical protein